MVHSLDRMAIFFCGPLDRVRSGLLRLLMPFLRVFISSREHRVALTGSLVIMASLGMALSLPLWQLALGPILLGTAHILADFRYCVVRPGFHRRWPLILGCGLPLLAMIFGQGLDIGLMSVAFAFALAQGPLWKRITGLGLVSCVATAVIHHGMMADVVFAHLHNIVAVLLWWAWRKRLGRGYLLVLVMYLAAWTSLLTGVFDGILGHHIGSPFGPDGLGLDYHAGYLGFGLGGIYEMRFVLAFAMAQSVHYWFWLRMVPEDDRKQYTPRSFRSSWWALRRDMGAVFLWLTLFAALGTTIWATVDLFAARYGYLRVIRFHGVMELSAAALLWVEGRDRLLWSDSQPSTSTKWARKRVE